MAHKLDKSIRTRDVIPSENLTFSDLYLSEPVISGLTKNGFERPSPIQLKAIPIGRCGLDLIVQAKSGTGKTCVFSVIALDSLTLNTSCIQVLVLAPTREIAVQIQQVIQSIGSCMTGLQCFTLIGGLPLYDDIENLKNCHIAIGTPGRVKQLIDEGHLEVESIRLFVLDEADKLMESGFQEVINWIYSTLPSNKQMLALSATYPEVLAQHLTAYMRNPTFIRLNASDPALLGIRQYYVNVPHNALVLKAYENKTNELIRILSSVDFNQCLVFSNYQMRAQSLSDMLNAQGWPATHISGAQDQHDRLTAMAQLKQYECRILISTDLTSRGIDAENVNLVINLDFPKEHETYLHRIGRAGRFGTYGAGISLVSSEQEMAQLRKIQEQCNTVIIKLPDPIPVDLAKSSGFVHYNDLVTTEQITTKHDDDDSGTDVDKLPDKASGECAINNSDLHHSVKDTGVKLEDKDNKKEEKNLNSSGENFVCKTKVAENEKRAMSPGLNSKMNVTCDKPKNNVKPGCNVSASTLAKNSENVVMCKFANESVDETCNVSQVPSVTQTSPFKSQLDSNNAEVENVKSATHTDNIDREIENIAHNLVKEATEECLSLVTRKRNVKSSRDADDVRKQVDEKGDRAFSHGIFSTSTRKIAKGRRKQKQKLHPWGEWVMKDEQTIESEANARESRQQARCENADLFNSDTVGSGIAVDLVPIGNDPHKRNNGHETNGRPVDITGSNFVRSKTECRKREPVVYDDDFFSSPASADVGQSPYSKSTSSLRSPESYNERQHFGSNASVSSPISPSRHMIPKSQVSPIRTVMSQSDQRIVRPKELSNQVQNSPIGEDFFRLKPRDSSTTDTIVKTTDRQLVSYDDDSFNITPGANAKPPAYNTIDGTHLQAKSPTQMKRVSRGTARNVTTYDDVDIFGTSELPPDYNPNNRQAVSYGDMDIFSSTSPEKQQGKMKKLKKKKSTTRYSREELYAISDDCRSLSPAESTKETANALGISKKLQPNQLHNNVAIGVVGSGEIAANYCGAKKLSKKSKLKKNKDDLLSAFQNIPVSKDGNKELDSLATTPIQKQTTSENLLHANYIESSNTKDVKKADSSKERKSSSEANTSLDENKAMLERLSLKPNLSATHDEEYDGAKRRIVSFIKGEHKARQPYKKPDYSQTLADLNQFVSHCEAGTLQTYLKEMEEESQNEGKYVLDDIGNEMKENQDPQKIDVSDLQSEKYKDVSYSVAVMLKKLRHETTQLTRECEDFVLCTSHARDNVQNDMNKHEIHAPQQGQGIDTANHSQPTVTHTKQQSYESLDKKDNLGDVAGEQSTNVVAAHKPPIDVTSGNNIETVSEPVKEHTAKDTEVETIDEALSAQFQASNTTYTKKRAETLRVNTESAKLEGKVGSAAENKSAQVPSSVGSESHIDWSIYEDTADFSEDGYSSDFEPSSETSTEGSITIENDTTLNDSEMVCKHYAASTPYVDFTQTKQLSESCGHHLIESRDLLDENNGTPLKCKGFNEMDDLSCKHREKASNSLSDKNEFPFQAKQKSVSFVDETTDISHQGVGDTLNLSSEINDTSMNALGVTDDSSLMRSVCTQCGYVTEIGEIHTCDESMLKEVCHNCLTDIQDLEQNDSEKCDAQNHKDSSNATSSSDFSSSSECDDKGVQHLKNRMGDTFTFPCNRLTVSKDHDSNVCRSKEHYYYQHHDHVRDKDRQHHKAKHRNTAREKRSCKSFTNNHFSSNDSGEVRDESSCVPSQYDGIGKRKKSYIPHATRSRSDHGHSYGNLESDFYHERDHFGTGYHAMLQQHYLNESARMYQHYQALWWNHMSSQMANQWPLYNEPPHGSYYDLYKVHAQYADYYKDLYRHERQRQYLEHEFSKQKSYISGMSRIY